MKRPYTVAIQVIKTVEYEIDDCNSPEEAEDIASQMASEGDFPNSCTEIEQEVIVVDSYPMEKGQEENDEEMLSA